MITCIDEWVEERKKKETERKEGGKGGRVISSDPPTDTQIYCVAIMLFVILQFL